MCGQTESLERWRWVCSLSLHGAGAGLSTFGIQPRPPVHSSLSDTLGTHFPPALKPSLPILAQTRQTHHRCSIALYGLKSPLELHLLLPRGNHGIVQGIPEVPDRGSHEFRPQSERKHSQSFCLKVFFAIAHPCLSNNL